MTNMNRFVVEAKSFLGFGVLTGLTRDAFAECRTLQEAILLVPTYTRRCADGLIKQVDIENTPEVLYFVAMGILGGTDFSACAQRFPQEIADELIKLEGLCHD